MDGTAFIFSSQMFNIKRKFSPTSKFVWNYSISPTIWKKSRKRAAAKDITLSVAHAETSCACDYSNAIWLLILRNIQTAGVDYMFLHK